MNHYKVIFCVVLCISITADIAGGVEFSDTTPVGMGIFSIDTLQLAVNKDSYAYLAYSGTETGGRRALYFGEMLGGVQSFQKIALEGCDCFTPSMVMGKYPGVVHIFFEGRCETGSEIFHGYSKSHSLPSL